MGIPLTACVWIDSHNNHYSCYAFRRLAQHEDLGKRIIADVFEAHLN